MVKWGRCRAKEKCFFKQKFLSPTKCWQLSDRLENPNNQPEKMVIKITKKTLCRKIFFVLSNFFMVRTNLILIAVHIHLYRHHKYVQLFVGNFRTKNRKSLHFFKNVSPSITPNKMLTFLFWIPKMTKKFFFAKNMFWVFVLMDYIEVWVSPQQKTQEKLYFYRVSYFQCGSKHTFFLKFTFF